MPLRPRHVFSLLIPIPLTSSTTHAPIPIVFRIPNVFLLVCTRRALSFPAAQCARHACISGAGAARCRKYDAFWNGRMRDPSSHDA
ncbi:hypothetical protein C8J57DRAFT_1326051 [Mycena rebaudengoi]|nr:hypothetical protein C8J57DRAFT_1326051 [Mycena rebaudengoi]